MFDEKLRICLMTNIGNFCYKTHFAADFWYFSYFCSQKLSVKPKWYIYQFIPFPSNKHILKAQKILQIYYDCINHQNHNVFLLFFGLFKIKMCTMFAILNKYHFFSLNPLTTHTFFFMYLFLRYLCIRK